MVMFKKSKFIHAVQNDDVEGARKLIEMGVAANGFDDLHPIILYAIAQQNREMTELLLAHGADLHAACSNHGGAIDVLQDTRLEADFTAFLLEKDPAFLNMQGRSGTTLMHIAASVGQQDVVALLLEKGADPHIRNRDNHMPYYLALKNGHPDIAKQLEPSSHKSQAAGWYRLSGERVAEVVVDEAIGYRLTEIFNFETRERLSIAQNVVTNVETRETKGFDDITDKTVLQRAHDAYEAAGGAISRETVYGRSIGKPQLRPGAGA